MSPITSRCRNDLRVTFTFDGALHHHSSGTANRLDWSEFRIKTMTYQHIGTHSIGVTLSQKSEFYPCLCQGIDFPNITLL